MFKWSKPAHKSTSSYEPKTPKISSISLPDDRYTPISFQPAYTEKTTKRGSFLKRFSTPDRRGSTTPMSDSWGSSHGVPLGKSRSRTSSTPVRDVSVEAPRPIRPHPSQGPVVPVTEHADKIYIDPSRTGLAPVGVPSAAYLEEQLRRERPDLVKYLPPSSKHSTQDYDSKMFRRSKNLSGTAVKTPSKAWLQEQEEQARRNAPSAPPSKKDIFKPWVEEDDDLKKLKPIPMVDHSDEPKQTTGNKPLKSALKKTPKPLFHKQLYKTHDHGDPKAYYSENDMEKRKSDWTRPTKVINTPSKAFLEEQRELMEDTKKHQHRSWMPVHHHSHSHPVPAPAPVHEIYPATFQHTHSSSTGSPTESMLPHEYHRSRRGSSTEGSRLRPSNYMPAYVKESQPTPPNWSEATPNLSWPLVEYTKRHRGSEPLVYFDAGFNPRYANYEVRARREGRMVPLSSEERNMLVSNNTLFSEIVIVNKTLEFWPIVIRPTHRIRVIDVFRAIYDTYAIPLTREELARLGAERIQRSERAFLQRCQDSPESTHFLERQGMTRIDLLRGRRIFKGLIHHRGAPNHQFELIFDEGPPRN